MSALAKAEKAVTEKLREKRVALGLHPTDIDQRVGMAPGWYSSFEERRAFPEFSLLLAIAGELQVPYQELFANIGSVSSGDVDRALIARSNGSGTDIHFKYSRNNAVYFLDGASEAQVDSVVSKLRSGLSSGPTTNQESETIKLNAVAESFLHAMQLWPNANPSDVWWFLVYRAFCDPLNHPPKDARLDHSQSWRRTSGWALEKIVVQHYSDFLAQNGVRISLATTEKKNRIVEEINVADRLEADKIDVVLEGETPEGPRFFGVVHVKASFAERRTDDIHMSQLLKSAGYTTPLWTMDCKSSPSDRPVNRGELGQATGNRSAKRKDIEDEGYFTRCFSYNSNTIPSPSSLPADRRIYLCNFRDANDQFSQFIVNRWKSFYAP